MGAAPTFLGVGDVYLALQRGTVEATMAGLTNIWDRKFYEVTKYVSLVDFLYGTMPVLMNKKKWDGLPTDIQKMMMEAAQEAQAWGRKEARRMQMEPSKISRRKGWRCIRFQKEKELK